MYYEMRWKISRFSDVLGSVRAFASIATSLPLLFSRRLHVSLAT